MSSTDHRRFWKEVFPKFLEATAIWTIVAGAIGWLTWKEINRQPDRVESGREIEFVSGDSHGVAGGSPIICQGIRVGQVTKVDPTLDPKPVDITGTAPESPAALWIRITGEIDPKYKDWNFDTAALIKSGSLTGSITGTPIVLTYTGKFPHADRKSTQICTLAPPEDTGEKINTLLAEVTKITTAFTDEIAEEKLPKDWPSNATPMRIGVIIHNLERASEVLKEASAKLDHEMDATHDATLMAQLHDIKPTIDELKLEAKEVLDSLDLAMKTLDGTIGSLDGKLSDVLGKTREDRQRPVRELTSALTRADQLLEQLNEILPRIGDTFVGRMVIKRPDEKPKTAPASE